MSMSTALSGLKAAQAEISATAHNISNVEIVERNGDVVKVRHNWFTLSVRYNVTDTFAGTSFLTIDFSGAKPVIKSKKVVLKNDYIRHVLDVYHL